MDCSEKVAVLLTCHNRKDKTLACLSSFFEATKTVSKIKFVIYLVDDGSTDGTIDLVKKRFPSVKIIMGNGNLYWAGGMRLAWRTAIADMKFNAFLLLNDDVVLKDDFYNRIIETDNYSLRTNKRRGIYSGSTVDRSTNKISYGGSKIKKSHFIVTAEKIQPTAVPQQCHFTNANILWVSCEVVNKIGIFDEQFIHGIADYDYSLRALKEGIPVYVTPGVCGYCCDDHGVNWKSTNIPLKERINYLKSPKGLASKEYLFYIRRHFPLFFPYSLLMLWIKTIFPQLWHKYKY